jgi:hypothetical protein
MLGTARGNLATFYTEAIAFSPGSHSPKKALDFRLKPDFQKNFSA